jgi:transposase
MEGHYSTGEGSQGAVERMGEEREGTRRRGRPRKRWKEKVERDLQVLRVRIWRELVTDREKWKDIIRQAKAHSGL